MEVGGSVCNSHVLSPPRAACRGARRERERSAGNAAPNGNILSGLGVGLRSWRPWRSRLWLLSPHYNFFSSRFTEQTAPPLESRWFKSGRVVAVAFVLAVNFIPRDVNVTVFAVVVSRGRSNEQGRCRDHKVMSLQEKSITHQSHMLQIGHQFSHLIRGKYSIKADDNPLVHKKSLCTLIARLCMRL